MQAGVAPGLRAGRGLKHAGLKHEDPSITVAPGLRAGRGLKHFLFYGVYLGLLVAPGLRAGRGLKQVPRTCLAERWK